MADNSPIGGELITSSLYTDSLSAKALIDIVHYVNDSFVPRSFPEASELVVQTLYADSISGAVLCDETIIYNTGYNSGYADGLAAGGGVSAVEYYLRGVDTGTNDYVYWNSTGSPDLTPVVTIPALTGSLVSTIVIGTT